MNILIADDSPSTAGLLDAIARKLGHRTILAADGAEAIAAFQAARGHERHGGPYLLTRNHPRRAEEILLAREAHWPATIADLYDPDAMPDDLRAAHDRNDETLERVYIGRRFRNDTERLETLFTMYTQMTANDAGSRADVSGQESGGLRKKVSGR